MPNFIEISDRNGQVTRNFSYRELYNPKTGLESHPLDMNIIECVQIIRDYFGVPIRITSTYRNYIPIGGVSDSPHMIGLAIDFQFIGEKSMVENLYMLIRDDFDSKGQLFQMLWNNGCRGFGSYDNFIHLDTRANAPNRWRRWNSEIYGRWNNMQALKYKEAIPLYDPITLNDSPQTSENSTIVETVQEISGAISGTVSSLQNREDGINILPKTIAIVVVSIAFVIVAILAFKFFL